MNSPIENSPTSLAFQKLADRCIQLCEKAKSNESTLPAEREPFLYGTLSDLTQQLELVLRLIEEESEDSGRKEQRKSLLRRLLKRDDGAPEGEDTDDIYLPDFDVSQQGLHGNSLTVPISDLVGFLSYGGKSGILWVDGTEENFLLGLVEGKLMHATSDKTPEGLRLGEVLVGLGYLTRRQLERFLSRSADVEDNVSGETLIESGLISEEELNEALVRQIKQLFYRLVSTRHAVFRFREGLGVQLAHQVDLDINQLLLNVARAQDEARAVGARPNELENWSTWRSELGSVMGAAHYPSTRQAPDATAIEQDLDDHFAMVDDMPLVVDDDYDEEAEAALEAELEAEYQAQLAAEAETAESEDADASEEAETEAGAGAEAQAEQRDKTEKKTGSKSAGKRGKAA